MLWHKWHSSSKTLKDWSEDCLYLFPHHNIKAPTRLVCKHDSRIVVISVGVDIKCDTEVYGAEFVKSCSNKT